MFDDPLMAHRPDPNPNEERWRATWMIGGVVVIVAHTWPQSQGGNRLRDGPHHQRQKGHGAREESL